jgi:hypothetical protein
MYGRNVGSGLPKLSGWIWYSTLQRQPAKNVSQYVERTHSDKRLNVLTVASPYLI